MLQMLLKRPEVRRLILPSLLRVRFSLPYRDPWSRSTNDHSFTISRLTGATSRSPLDNGVSTLRFLNTYITLRDRVLDHRKRQACVTQCGLVGTLDKHTTTALAKMQKALLGRACAEADGAFIAPATFNQSDALAVLAEYEASKPFTVQVSEHFLSVDIALAGSDVDPIVAGEFYDNSEMVRTLSRKVKLVATRI